MSLQRDHLFNRSTRPLLESRSPHQTVQVKKKSAADYKLHGFNDFNFVANQYKNLSNPHTGYPYGSPPPSPTLQHQQQQHRGTRSDYSDSLENDSNNFMFTDDSGIHSGNNSQFSNQSTLPVLATSYYDDVINNTSNNCNNDYHNYHTPIENRKNYKKGFFKGWTKHSGSDCGGSKKVATVAPTTINQLSGNGPFIFGVHSSSYYTLPKVNNESVIHSSMTTTATSATATTKYSPIDANHMRNDNIYHQDIDNGKAKCKDKKKDQRLSKKRRCRTKRGKWRKNKREKADDEIKCVLVGDGMVGKTNLILSYLEHRFTTEHVPTASDIYNFEVKVDESPVQVTLCDTAGQDFLDPLRRLCYPDSDVFLLCFSVVKPDTFASIQDKWAPNFRKSRASIVLIGTQADLRTDPRVVSTLSARNEKPVSKSDAWDYAASIGAKYIETSSRTNKNVKEAFDTAIWDALRSLNSPVPPMWKRLLCLA